MQICLLQGRTTINNDKDNKIGDICKSTFVTQMKLFYDIPSFHCQTTTWFYLICMELLGTGRQESYWIIVQSFCLISSTTFLWCFLIWIILTPANKSYNWGLSWNTLWDFQCYPPKPHTIFQFRYLYNKSHHNALFCTWWDRITSREEVMI